MNTVHALAKAVDAKDGYTHSHSQRVARYAATLAEQMDLPSSRVEMVRTAGVLHDVGKIGISDNLLLKPGRLTDEQMTEMRRHSELGRDIIAGAGIPEIADLVLYLHERFDGKGYPAGLAGEEIPIESRILHVADTLEAMTSSRVYRKALSVETALAELECYAGIQFDPVACRALIEMVESGLLEVGVEATLVATADSTSFNGEEEDPSGVAEPLERRLVARSAVAASSGHPNGASFAAPAPEGRTFLGGPPNGGSFKNGQFYGATGGGSSNGGSANGARSNGGPLNGGFPNEGSPGGGSSGEPADSRTAGAPRQPVKRSESSDLGHGHEDGNGVHASSRRRGVRSPEPRMAPFER